MGELLDVSASVVGLDGGPVAGGAAGRNGGFLLAGTALFHHDAVARLGRERAAAIYRETLAEIDRLAADLGPLVRRTGSLRLASSAAEADDCARQLAALRADGFPAEPAEGGLVVPSDGAVDPLARCRLIAERAARAGARLHGGSPVVELAGDRVATPDGEVTCAAVVVAVDGGLERLLPELVGRVRSTRLQMLGTEPVAPGLHPRPVYHRYGYDYWQQLPDGRVVLGGRRDRHTDSEWGAPAEPDAAVQQELDVLLREQAGVDALVTHRWAGVVAYTDDGLPLLEEVRPGVIVTGAYCGHGNVLGAAAGRAAARIALGGRPPQLARLFRPEHWG